MHLGFVLAGHAEYVLKVAFGIEVAARPGVNHGAHFHATFRTHLCGFFRVHFDVVGHGFTLHQHPGLGADGVEYSHEGALRALNYLYHFAFLALVLAALAGHCHDDGVAVQGLASLRGFDENVFVHAFHDDEDEAFAGHLDAAGVFGIVLSGFRRAGALFGAFGGFSAHLLVGGGFGASGVQI